MLTIATITDKARKTLQDTPNIFQIALIPVLISVSVQLFSSTRQSILEVYLSQDGSNFHLKAHFVISLGPYFLHRSSMFFRLNYLFIEFSPFTRERYRGSNSL